MLKNGITNKQTLHSLMYNEVQLYIHFIFLIRTLTNLASQREGYMLQKDRSKAKNVLQVRLVTHNYI